MYRHAICGGWGATVATCSSACYHHRYQHHYHYTHHHREKSTSKSAMNPRHASRGSTRRIRHSTRILRIQDSQDSEDSQDAQYSQVSQAAQIQDERITTNLMILGAGPTRSSKYTQIQTQSRSIILTPSPRSFGGQQVLSSWGRTSTADKTSVIHSNEHTNIMQRVVVPWM